MFNKSKEGLELNGSHQLLVYADVNLMGQNVKIVKKNTEALYLMLAKKLVYM
jgi:hypothetical protein